MPAGGCAFARPASRVLSVMRMPHVRMHIDLRAAYSVMRMPACANADRRAPRRYNIDIVAQYIATKIPVPVRVAVALLRPRRCMSAAHLRLHFWLQLRDFTSRPRMIVIRSFDVNMPGEDAASLTVRARAARMRASSVAR